ncbi:MAG: beta-ketoacyl synthase N-terminal-like domain-containing protein [Dehalococcoidia bacterium]
MPAGREFRPDGSATGFFAAPIPDDYRTHPEIPRNLSHFLDRGSAMAVDAALQAVASAGLGAGSGDSRRFAVADGLPYRAPGQPVLFVPYGHMVARALGVRGLVEVVGGAEASGMTAIVAAARLVSNGDADVVIAGAAQALQEPLLEHFRAQGFSSRQPARPFDAAHAGCVPAEAAAYVVIEAESHARERGAPAIARIAGSAEIFDTTAEPLAYSDAAEAGRVQQLALGNAGFLQNQVDLMVSCADGRLAIDFSEGYGVMRTFGRHAYYAGVTTVSGGLGFAMGASGPLSVAMALEAIRQQTSFPIAGFETGEQGVELAYVREPREEKIDCILVTSMGIGGTLAAVLLHR